MTLTQLATKLKGGPGSGNFGHSGRPGKRGGSGPGGGSGGKFIGFENSKVAGFNEFDEKLEAHYGLENKCGGEINCRSIENYTDTGHADTNKFLRFVDDVNLTDPPHTTVKKDIIGIDDSMNNAPRTPQNMLVYRGITKNRGADMNVGDSFTDKGFVSTSISRQFAKNWTTSDGVVLEIRVPKGSKGLYVDQITAHRNEHEFIMPRGSKFNVVEKTVASSGQTNLVVELV